MAFGRTPLAVIALICAAILSSCGDDSDDPAPSEGEHLIVSVGDSVASGEGNPAPSGRRWLRPSRCHRSEVSGHRIAANELIAANPDASLRFVSYACSGATIEHGLLGKFKPNFFESAERPQLERVDELTPPAEVDALLVSVGANDVSFQNIVTFCILEEPCQDSRSFGPARRWARKNQEPVPTLDRFVEIRLKELRSDYERVDAAIPPEIPRERVLIVEYFDPTRAPAGTQCPIFRKLLSDQPEEGRVSVSETTWAHDHLLLPLNETIRAAAEDDNHWTLVDGVDEAFDGHGVCAEKPKRWVNAFNDSFDVQDDHRGTLHPNDAGYRATAELIGEKLEDALRQ